MATEGLHFNVPEDEYHTWDGASSSRLNQLRQSPAHCKMIMTTGKAPTKAMIVGSAIHAAILTPKIFHEQYGVVPADFNGRTAEGKEMKAQLVQKYGERLIDRELLETTIQPVVDAVGSHAAASQLIKSATQLEASAYWLGDRGVARKARVDGYVEELGIAFDLKTTTDAKASEFARNLYVYGYHLQAAHYLDALKRHGKDIQHFVFIVVEKSEPFGVGVYRLTNEAVMAGQVQLERLLKKFDECTLSDSWPCYSDKIEDIGLPQWALNQINEETVNE